MKLLATPASDFVVEPPTAEISTGWQGQVDPLRGHAAAVAAAGGVWEAHGRRSGHQVCWRTAGAELELSETCLLPGAALFGGELRLRFAASLLPPIGLVQMADDALLLSAAMHAPSGGVFVYQLLFELPHDPDLVHGAVVRARAAPARPLARPAVRPCCGGSSSRCALSAVPRRPRFSLARGV